MKTFSPNYVEGNKKSIRNTDDDRLMFILDAQ